MKRFLVVIVGIIFLGVGGFLYYKNNTLIKNCTVETTATVVDMKQELSTDSDSTSSYMYYPIIEYKVNDDTIRVTMDSGSNHPAYDINEKITIKYNPKKVKQYIVKGDNTSSIYSIVFLVIGVFVTGYGIYVAVKPDKIGG